MSPIFPYPIADVLLPSLLSCLMFFLLSDGFFLFFFCYASKLNYFYVEVFLLTVQTNISRVILMDTLIASLSISFIHFGYIKTYTSVDAVLKSSTLLNSNVEVIAKGFGRDLQTVHFVQFCKPIVEI